MKIPKIFLFAIGSSLLAITASAALPAFSQTINLPPLTLAENAKANLHPFERSEPAAPMRIIVPERSVVRADKFTFSPPAGVDYKLLIKRPDPSVDYRMIVKEAGQQSGK